MKTSKIRENQSGVAHLGLIVLLVVVAAVGVFAYLRVSQANKPSDSSTSEQQSEVIEEEAELLESEKEAESATGQSGLEETENVE